MKDLVSSASGRYLLRLLLCGGAYAAVTYLSLVYLVPADGTGASLVWPTAALGLALLYLWGADLWPGLLLGSFATFLLLGYSPVLACTIALGNVIESLLARYLLGLASFNPMFSRLRDTLAFIAVAIIVTFVSSLWIATSAYLLYFGTSFSTTLWSSLWVGHAVSMLALGPFLLYWLNRPIFYKTRKEILEGVGVFGVIGVLAYVTSWTAYSMAGPIPLLYILVIALVWSSLRTGPRGIALALAMVSILFATGVLFGHPHLTQPIEQTLFGVQVMLGILSIIFLPFTSITEERKDAVRTLERHVGQLEEALSKIQGEDQAKTDFIAILAHELRNPLSPILSSIELMKQDGMGEDNPNVRSIASHVHMMARLLDDLLDISRISQKKFKLEVEPVEFETIVHQTLEIVKPFMEARKHDLIVRLPQDPVWLNADPIRLTQVFVNLLNNAAKYTDPGGRIVFSASREPGQLVITIKDNGIGIAPERLKNVFEPFGGAEGVERKPGGLRIGMSLAKRMTEMHRGTISVSSAGVGMGTQFTVTLPLPPTSPLPLDNSPARRNARRRFSREHATRYAQESGNPKIVVVDDNEPAANALMALLRGNEHEVVVAYTGADGLATIKRERPGVALLDIGLPDMDGHDLARQIRQELGDDLILIALTGFGQGEDKMRAREAGFNEHLTKPVSIVDLERVIRELRSGH